MDGLIKQQTPYTHTTPHRSSVCLREITIIVEVCMERSPPDIQKLVCDSCWRTVFSIKPFHIAWSAKSAPRRSKSAGFSYTSPTWEQMQHSIDSMQCGWCGFLSRIITVDCQSYFPTAPPNSKTFQLRIRFRERSNIGDEGSVDDPYPPSVNVDPTTELCLAIDDRPEFSYCVHTVEGMSNKMYSRSGPHSHDP